MKGVGLEFQLKPTLVSFVPSGRSLNLSELRFSHLQFADNNACFIAS